MDGSDSQYDPDLLSPDALPDSAYADEAYLGPRHGAWRFALLLVVTVAAFWPTFGGGFLWQDDQLVTDNPATKTTAGLSWYVTHPSAVPGHYRPAATALFWLEHQPWKDRFVEGYRLVSLALHLLVVAAVWLILKRLTVASALIAATLFAVHPLGLQPVAWVSRQPTLLAALLGCLSLLLLLRVMRLDDFVPDDDRDAERWFRLPRSPWVLYALAGAWFVVGLLSEPAVMTFVPIALMLVAFWKHGRADRPTCVVAGALLTVGIAWAWLVGHWHYARDIDQPTWIECVAAAPYGTWLAFSRQFWPVRVPFVDDASVAAGGTRLLVGGVLLLGCLIAAVWLVRSESPARRGLGFTLAFFLAASFTSIALLPAEARVTSIGAATYVARLGLLVPVAVLLTHAATIASARMKTPAGDDEIVPPFVLFVRRLPHTLTRVGVMCLPALLLICLTFDQGRMFTSSREAWTSTVAATPDAFVGRRELGRLLLATKDPQAAETQFLRAVELKPTDGDVRLRLGQALQAQGKTAEAIGQYTRVSLARPNDAEAIRLEASARAASGQTTVALGLYEKALSVAPADDLTRNNYATLLARLGRIDEAVAQYQEAIRRNPRLPAMRLNLANLLFAMGRFEEASAQLKAAVESDPYNASAYMSAGSMLMQFKEFAKAAQMFRVAVRLNPESAEAYNSLGVSAAAQGKYSEAVFHFTRALEIRPDYASAQRNLIAARKDAAGPSESGR